jgi:hypothetical protein
MNRALDSIEEVSLDLFDGVLRTQDCVSVSKTRDSARGRVQRASQKVLAPVTARPTS